MESWRLRGALAAALAVCALGAVPAHAADPPSQPVTPITIGDGYLAGVTVDDAGTAHIAWLGNEFDPNTLHYCRLPRGATACAVTTQIAADGNSGSRPFVVVDGNIVQVVNY